MTAVLLSGGWDSVYCLLKAQEKDKDVTGYFFDYAQPYLEQELEAVKNLEQQLKFKLVVVKVDSLGSENGVFDNRNRRFIEYVAAQGHKVIYFGTRNLLYCFDRYKDSNWQFARDMSKELGVDIKVPATCLPKFVIIDYVRRKGVSDSFVYSSEGYKYTN